MSNRVNKSRVSKPSAPKKKKSASESNRALHSVILDHCIEMPSCSACEDRGLEVCQVSQFDSSRCAECVRLGKTRCDVMGPSPDDLRYISRQYRELEAQIEAEEERRRITDARIERLRKQKKMWSSKMHRAIRRGLDSVDELDRVEAEESRAAKAAEAAKQAEGAVVEEPRAVPEVENVMWSPVDLSGVDMDALLASGSGSGS
ncbi:hypothetical protein VM1G_00771 [Cytospora mali]|uniref:Uncharacterized protein n=1 Tax=Cytospora mali TaxID=578113 RepID=A0A194VL17_CYTMA|nr:hypothetical protein VM1G_00771 [Valsa mali]